MGNDVQERRNACEQNETEDVLEFEGRVVVRVVAVAVENVGDESELSGDCSAAVSRQRAGGLGGQDVPRAKMRANVKP